jgi:(p)ppGpp synthase/HD superfamily hydrolase
MNKLDKAREFAKQAHESVNQTYDGKPYFYHLSMVQDAAVKFGHLVPDDKKEDVFSACYLHDCIEDCRKNFNEIKSEFGNYVAELVYACTNEKGRNRKERANAKYYAGIREVPYATFVKLCDRIANIKNGIEQQEKENVRMSDMYEKENPNFVSELYDEKFSEMFDYIDEMLKKKQFQS